MKKKKINKKTKKVTKDEVIESQIPTEVKIALGKFYIFSIVYVIFFGIIYPFVLINNISIVSLILSLILLIVFYIYILIDVIKKKLHFTSTLFVILVVLVFALISFSIVKLVF